MLKEFSGALPLIIVISVSSLEFKYKKVAQMEERKLNFNTPLMSVRRLSTSGSSSLGNFLANRRRTLPPYNSSLNVEQVTEPVAVPFTWEQIPGIAKNLSQPEPHALDQLFEKGSEDRVLNESLRSPEGPTRDGGDEMERTCLEDDNDEDDVYSDAPESFSPAESVSFSFDYSVSSLGGFDGPAAKPSGTFSIDPQTRDLMISRFLPAARAMILEPPQYASQKQQQRAIVSFEQPKEVNREREPVRDIRTLPSKNDSNIIQQCHGHDVGEEDESEDENGEVDDDYGIVQGKGCGLIPKLRLKSSLGLLNPIPGMKVRTQNSLSVTSRAKKSFKDGYSQANDRSVLKDADYNYGSDRGTPTLKTLRLEKLSAGGSRRFNFSGELQTTRGSLSPFRRSRTNSSFPQQNAENEKHSDRAALTPKLPGIRTKPFAGSYNHFNYSGEFRPVGSSSSPYVQSRADSFPSQKNADHERRSYDALTPKLWDHNAQPFAGGLQRYNLSGELQAMKDSVSPYRHSTTGAFSIQQNERSRSPLARVRVHREVESIEKNSSNSPIESRRDQLLQTSFGVEKTVYVDRINIARNSYSNSRSSKQELWMEPEATSQEYKSSEYSHSSTKRDLMLSSAQTLKGDIKMNFDSDSLPPRLKSPSESWLHQALPSIPSGSPFTPKKQSPRLFSSYETKWETIVRSSNLHHDHARYSQELVTHATRMSKSKS